MNIIQPSSPIWTKPNENSQLETEALFGESVEILETYKKKWVFCKLLTDNYLGWMRKEDLGKLNPTTHRIISNRL